MNFNKSNQFIVCFGTKDATGKQLLMQSGMAKCTQSVAAAKLPNFLFLHKISKLIHF